MPDEIQRSLFILYYIILYYIFLIFKKGQFHNTDQFSYIMIRLIILIIDLLNIITFEAIAPCTLTRQHLKLFLIFKPDKHLKYCRCRKDGGGVGTIFGVCPQNVPQQVF